MANDLGEQVVALVGVGRTVLHVGCGDGSLAESLVGNGCVVSGVSGQTSPAAARALEELVVADLDDVELRTHFKPGAFDVVVIAASAPAATLRDAAGLLRDGGRLLVTARNAAHGSRRLALLLGHPVEGHRDLVTSDQLFAHLEGAALTVHEVHSTVRDPLDGMAANDAARLPSTVVEWVRFQPDALDESYVAVASATDAPDDFPSRPAVTPAVPADRVRLEDEHTRWVARDREERHRMLTVRDHIIGLEASLVSADERVQRARMRARAAGQRTRRVRGELEALVDEIDILARTRAGRTELHALVARLRELRDERTEPQ